MSAVFQQPWEPTTSIRSRSYRRTSRTPRVRPLPPLTPSVLRSSRAGQHSMALKLSGEGRPLLGSPTSPAEQAPGATELHVRWSCLEALPPEPPPGTELQLQLEELGKPPVPVYSSMLSTDSGCESEGGVSDSVYSTVTSCNSDLVRMQLEPLPSEEAEEQEQEQPVTQPAESAPPPPLPPPETTDDRRSVDRRVRSDDECVPVFFGPHLFPTSFVRIR